MIIAEIVSFETTGGHFVSSKLEGEAVSYRLYTLTKLVETFLCLAKGS